MARTVKILGQQAPAATTPADLYTVPASTSTIVSTITVANRSGTATTFRISIAPAGAATDNTQYIAYDVSISGNETIAFTIGATLSATDKIRVYAGTANITFAAFGQEST